MSFLGVFCVCVVVVLVFLVFCNLVYFHLTLRKINYTYVNFFPITRKIDPHDSTFQFVKSLILIHIIRHHFMHSLEKTEIQKLLKSYSCKLGWNRLQFFKNCVEFIPLIFLFVSCYKLFARFRQYLINPCNIPQLSLVVWEYVIKIYYRYNINLSLSLRNNRIRLYSYTCMCIFTYVVLLEGVSEKAYSTNLRCTCKVDNNLLLSMV